MVWIGTDSIGENVWSRKNFKTKLSLLTHTSFTILLRDHLHLCVFVFFFHPLNICMIIFIWNGRFHACGYKYVSESFVNWAKFNVMSFVTWICPVSFIPISIYKCCVTRMYFIKRNKKMCCQHMLQWCGNSPIKVSNKCVCVFLSLQFCHLKIFNWMFWFCPV